MKQNDYSFAIQPYYSMSMLQSRQFKEDLQAYLNYHQYPDGKNRYGHEVKLLSPEEFVSKYEDFFGDDTDPSRLPKDAAGMALMFASAAAGAKKSIARDKIDSKSIKTLLNEDSEIKNALNPKNYKSTSQDDDGEPIDLFFYTEEQVKQFTQDLLLATDKIIEDRVKNAIESIKYDVETTINQKIQNSESLVENIINDITSKKVPELINREIERTRIGHMVNRYSDKVLRSNPDPNNPQMFNNPLFQYFIKVGNEKMVEFWNKWQAQATEKLLATKEIPGNENITNDKIEMLTKLAFSEICAQENVFMDTSFFPSAEEKEANTQQVPNTQKPAENQNNIQNAYGAIPSNPEPNVSSISEPPKNVTKNINTNIDSKLLQLFG